MRTTIASAAVFSAVIFNTVAAPAQPKPAPTVAERLAGWKSQRVTILSNQPSWCTGGKNEGPSLFWKENSPGKRIAADRCAGRSGTIAEVATQPETRIVIDLDVPVERIVAGDDHGIGFQAELDTAGQPLWSKGTQTIAPLDFECQALGKGGERIALTNLERVTVTGAEPGTHLQHVMVRVKTGEGTEGWLDGSEGYDMVDERFHLPNSYGVATRPYSYRFHHDDPRKGRHGFKPAVWQLIGRQRRHRNDRGVGDPGLRPLHGGNGVRSRPGNGRLDHLSLWRQELSGREGKRDEVCRFALIEGQGRYASVRLRET